VKSAFDAVDVIRRMNSGQISATLCRLAAKERYIFAPHADSQ
jgi:hypothetical protein